MKWDEIFSIFFTIFRLFLVIIRLIIVFVFWVIEYVEVINRINIVWLEVMIGFKGKFRECFVIFKDNLNWFYLFEFNLIYNLLSVY